MAPFRPRPGIWPALCAVALGCALVLGPSAAGASSPGCTPGTDWGTNRPDLAQQVLALVNQHRASLGLSQLVEDQDLEASATWKSLHMAEYGYFDHPDPAPPVARTVDQRLSDCGYPASSAGWGENIAYGFTTADAVMAAWLASPGHRANIEEPSYRALGVGVAVAADGRYEWTQDFGTVAAAPAGSVTPASATPAAPAAPAAGVAAGSTPGPRPRLTATLHLGRRCTRTVTLAVLGRNATSAPLGGVVELRLRGLAGRALGHSRSRRLHAAGGGWHTSLGGLPPGRYRLLVRYSGDATRRPATLSRTLRVRACA